MSNGFQWLCQRVLIGPVLRLHGRPQIAGREHIPRRGPVILAANHLAVVDSFYIALVARRPVTFLAKDEYFTGTGVAGLLQRSFFRALGQIPVDRRGGSAASGALVSACRVLARGDAWGVHPEGSRSPTGELFRGHTGVVRVALATGAPIVPVAICGTEQRTGSAWWRSRRVSITVLPPLPLPAAVNGEVAIRRATDELMSAIAEQTGQRYVDRYIRARDDKRQRGQAA